MTNDSRPGLIRHVPAPLLRQAKAMRTAVRRFRGARRLKHQLRTATPIRIIIGSGALGAASGWIETDIEYLNLLSPGDWAEYFERNTIAAILAEHVWEHLTLADGLAAARLCHDYLQPGGYLRLAVPDGFHPDPAYIEAVKIGGSGPGADDHKVLYNHVSLQNLLERAGFTVEPLEYFNISGGFYAAEWNPADGMVRRSRRFDARNHGAVLRYTSLIVDARK